MNTLKHTVYTGNRRYLHTPEHYSYRSMKQRCLNQNAREYPQYGGRGIKICDRWLDDNGFENFLEDLGKRPAGTTLDRKDVNGDYDPTNCRWSNWNIQNHNQRTRSTNKSGFRGVSLEKRSNKWIATIWQNYVMQFLGLHETPEQAALAYDCAAIQLYGSDAQLNILGGDTNV